MMTEQQKCYQPRTIQKQCKDNSSNSMLAWHSKFDLIMSSSFANATLVCLHGANKICLDWHRIWRQIYLARSAFTDSQVFISCSQILLINSDGVVAVAGERDWTTCRAVYSSGVSQIRSISWPTSVSLKIWNFADPDVFKITRVEYFLLI